MSKPKALTSSINYYRALFRRPQNLLDSRSTGVINMPTLLIWGEQDVALDISLTEALDQWVTNLQVKRIRDSGHWVQQEQPELVNHFLKEFLQSSPKN